MELMTLIARLCALCAACTLMQTILNEKRRESFRVIGGLLMLHLVIDGVQRMALSLKHADDLGRLIETLMK